MERNILIIQNFNPNKGNNSVISAMMYALKDDNVNIEITAAVPSKGTAQYGVTCYEWLVSYEKMMYGASKSWKMMAACKEFLWVTYLMTWILFYKLGFQLYVPKRKRPTIDAYRRCDAVVFSGGHSFTTMNGLGFVFSHCVGLYFGKVLGKKTMVYSHTIGPFDGKFKWILKPLSMFVLKRTDLITVREKDSLKYCKDCHAVLTAEAVFAMPTDMSLAKDVAELKKLKIKGKPIIGLTIHHIYYKYFFTKEEYIHHMVDILNMVTIKYDCNVLLIPMETKMAGRYNDRDLAHEMKKQMTKPEHFEIIDGDYLPAVSASIIANTDMFIGTKTHSIVYGLKSEVPTLCIAYQQKANEFMDMYGCLQNSINLKDLNVVSFERIFDRMLNNLEEIRSVQRENNIKVRDLSLRNKNLLLELLNNGKNSN